ncbi:hypothetical protein [Nannocystis exedens]|uniref:hypothetical protein n=1 Tax=Nannocystis exedens TaxID=54 RepID=UPI000BD6308B|nr:hypothetical protein [Nannocystis exedens]PCC73807.1 hypothetical protein NAEX_06895 [Nannocystis exedens]
MTKLALNHTSALSPFTPDTADPLGPKHAKLLAFLATRGQVAFDLKQVKRARQLIAAARAELLGPLPSTTTATIIDGWVRRITLPCREARALWPALAACPPALIGLEEIEVVFDDELEAWIEVAARHPLRVTRFYLNAEYVDPETGRFFDLSDGSARIAAATTALAYATDLAIEVHTAATSSFAALDLPELQTLAVLSMGLASTDHDSQVLSTLWQARCPQLRRVAWECFGPLDPAAALAAPRQVTEIGVWGPSHAAVLAALAARRPSLTALGVAHRDGDDDDDLDDDALRRLGEGRRLFGPRFHYVGGFNAGFRLHYRLERRADAEAQFATLRARVTDDADLHFQYGNALDDDHATINAYCAALIVDPDHGPSHYNLGDVLLRLGRPRVAIYHLRRYLAVEPGFTHGWRDLARAHRELGEETEALAAEANIPPE